MKLAFSSLTSRPCLCLGVQFLGPTYLTNINTFDPNTYGSHSFNEILYNDKLFLHGRNLTVSTLYGFNWLAGFDPFDSFNKVYVGPMAFDCIYCMWEIGSSHCLDSNWGDYTHIATS